MKKTISILVENHPGVLSRISGLFARRGFNIESVAVGVTDDAAVSRITIVADETENVIEQIEKQLNKLIDVIKLKTLNSNEIISRELMLVKIAVTSSERGEVIDIAKIIGAKICDITRTAMTVEVSDSADRLENILELLKPYGIKEVVRTGTIAMQKGMDYISVKSNK